MAGSIVVLEFSVNLLRKLSRIMWFTILSINVLYIVLVPVPQAKLGIGGEGGGLGRMRDT